MFIFDIETDGLLDTVTKIHCLVIRDTNTGVLHSLHGKRIEDGISMLVNSTEKLVGHNIISFDVPVIEKLYGVSIDPNRLIDTLIVARLRYPEVITYDLQHKAMNRPHATGKLQGRHSLEAWGERLGEKKGTFGKTTDWKNWTPEMQIYCDQDVHVTEKLLEGLDVASLSEKALDIEHKFAYYIALQERSGCPFNVQAAEKLRDEVRIEADKFHFEVCNSIPDKVIEETFIPKVNSPKFGYKKGVPFIKTTTIPFNPSSRQQIVAFFKDKYQWEPKDFTDKGNPEVNDEVLQSLPYPEAKKLASLFEANKLLSQLSDGDNAWLKLQKNGRIHGYVNTNGAITGRCTHSSPNLGQVPAKHAFKGKECRGLFYSPSDEYSFVGGDASALELRILAHYLYPYDNGAYVETVINGDIHTHNQKAAGLKTRDQAKTFIYAYLYGAGDSKLGITVDPLANEQKAKDIGRTLRNSFTQRIPAMGLLTNDVKSAFKHRGFIKAIDGRILRPRAEHSALNTLLQSAGAILVKKATCILHEKIKGLDCYPVLHIHDEVQLIAHNSIAETVGKMIPEAIKEAGEYLKLNCPMTGEYKIGRSWSETH